MSTKRDAFGQLLGAEDREQRLAVHAQVALVAEGGEQLREVCLVVAWG